MKLTCRTQKGFMCLSACLTVSYLVVWNLKWDGSEMYIIKDECPWYYKGTIDELTEVAVTWQKEQNENELWNTSLTNDEHKELLEVTKEGKKKLVVVFATFRSGSSFLGDLLQSHPAVYYNFEPLWYLHLAKIGNRNLEEVQLKVIENLADCKHGIFEELGISQKFERMLSWIKKFNKRLWTHCDRCNVSLCKNATFISSICETFPFHVMKLVRMRLRNAQKLLEDNRKEVKVIHLVRDPRGIWASRAELSGDWCRNGLRCLDPKYLCSDQVEDFYSYKQLKEQYPTKVLFEKMALSPEDTGKSLIRDLGLSFHPRIKKFIITHTQKRKGNDFSTFRNSSAVADHWKSYFTGKAQELRYVEDACDEAMQLWGYSRFSDHVTTHMRDS